jgi:hypothetical protein
MISFVINLVSGANVEDSVLVALFQNLELLL